LLYAYARHPILTSLRFILDLNINALDMRLEYLRVEQKAKE